MKPPHDERQLRRFMSYEKGQSDVTAYVRNFRNTSRLPPRDDLIQVSYGEKPMNIYRLDPIDPNDPSWQNSVEKNSLWTSAATPKDARDLVADKTRLGVSGANGFKSPWQDEAITSCVWEPSMTHIHAGTVVRADGSLVEKRMNIYRLDPIDPNHPSWQNSVENDTVWASAPTPQEARDLAAEKTKTAVLGAIGLKSPWQDASVTSCVWEPSMTTVDPWTVARADGSIVGIDE
ncbi:MAG: hypothetical protein WCF20_11875 [Methylovirgula sp.]